MNLRRGAWLLLTCVMVCLAGCGRPKPAAPPPAATSAPPANLLVPTNAQPKLRTLKLWLGAQELTAELALSRQEISTGMMFRKEIGEHEGMLFVFARPHRATFYMKNTYVPLSSAYVDSAGAILEIHDLKPLDETPIEAASDRVQFVLEVKQGWFERNKIGVGAVIRTERGSLPETLFNPR